MQSRDEEARKRAAEKQRGEAKPELSEAWRQLLGLEEGEKGKAVPDSGSTQQSPQVPTADAQAEAETLEPLAGDPWNDLLHTRGIEEIDLQKVHLHKGQIAEQEEQDSEVEQALHFIQEGAEKKSGNGKPGGKAKPT